MQALGFRVSGVSAETPEVRGSSVLRGAGDSRAEARHTVGAEESTNWRVAHLRWAKFAGCDSSPTLSGGTLGYVRASRVEKGQPANETVSRETALATPREMSTIELHPMQLGLRFAALMLLPCLLVQGRIGTETCRGCTEGPACSGWAAGAGAGAGPPIPRSSS